ncbi:hypothetical protein EQ500_13720, partial [Lactobacillus sp. XV13L]|nr:hypothetical protein [Lactobacillus sp. XV13L]
MSKQPIYSNKPLVYFGSGSADLSQGSFSVKADNLGDYDNTNRTGKGVNGLMNVGADMNIKVRYGGTFSIVVGPGHNQDHPLNLLYSGGTMNISIVNPANVTLDLTEDPCDASALVYADNSNRASRTSTVVTVPQD